ncbi:MAG: histidine phosphatase family protein [Cellvibrionaceae bacterium]|nr:histidine phosphatase family protein [Cellvibrionaceae bacterium]
MSNDVVSLSIDLLRHGECEGGNIFRGSTDVALSQRGFQQMESALNNAKPPWQLVISSPLKRCHAFAAQFCAKHQIPLQTEPRLRELHFGDWEGKPIAEILQTDAERIQAWSQDPSSIDVPNGEKLSEALARAEDLLEELKNRPDNHNILLISHGGLIRLILSTVLHIPLSKCQQIDVPYAALSRFAYYRSAFGTQQKLLAHNYRYEP